MKSKTLFPALAILLLGAQPAQASELWTLDQPMGERFGVQVKEWHTSPKDLDAIRDAGFGTLRYGIGWSDVERSPGEYTWTKYDNFIKEVKARKFRSVVILGGGNPLYTKVIPAPADDPDHRKEIALPPTQPEALAALAKFVTAAAERYKDSGIVWEMWNEPDQPRFWAPDADAKSYVMVATTLCRAIKKADPSAKVIGPGAAGMPDEKVHMRPSFIGVVLNSDASACFDAISAHSYRIRRGSPVKNPESVMDDNREAISYIAKHMPEGRTPLPFLSTEWGYSTALSEAGKEPPIMQVTPEKHADFALRMPFANALSGVPLTILYEWRESMHGDTNAEAHFGVTDFDGNDKPAVVALREFFPRVRDAIIEKRVETPNADDFVLLMKHQTGKYSYVYWTARENMDGGLRLKIGDGEAVAMTSRPQIVDAVRPVQNITVINGSAAP